MIVTMFSKQALWSLGGGLVAFSLALAGCAPKAKRPTIFVVPRDTAEALWVTEHTGAAEAGAAANVHVYWNGPNDEDDVEQQIVLAERAIRRDAYGLILSPNSPFALNTVVHRAIARKIPVVITGASIPLQSAPNLFFVESDVQMIGFLAAKRIAAKTGEIGVIGLDPLSPGSIDRAEAFTTSLQKLDPQVQVVAKLTGTLNFGKLESDTEQMIREHPHLISIFALNVTSTRAAAAAVRSMHAGDRIRIVGCDQTLDLLFLIRQGVIDSLVIQNMRAIGNDAVNAVVAARKRKAFPSVTMVAPALLTRDNIDSESMQYLLLMNWRIHQ